MSLSSVLSCAEISAGAKHGEGPRHRAESDRWWNAQKIGWQMILGGYPKGTPNQIIMGFLQYGFALFDPAT